MSETSTNTHSTDPTIPGQDPDTRLTILPASDIDGSHEENVTPSTDLVHVPRLAPTFGQRITALWQRTTAQSIIAGIEHVVLAAFAGLLVALVYELLRYEVTFNGDIVRNDVLHEIVGNHMWWFAIGIVLSSIVHSTADLIIHYLHTPPQNKHEFVLMYRTFNLAIAKGFGVLFIGLVTLALLTGHIVVFG